MAKFGSNYLDLSKYGKRERLRTMYLVGADVDR